jgi:hypothetical protein
MKELYYYEYSDDGISWTRGGAAISLISCIDKARQCDYRHRIKRAIIAREEIVSEDEIKPEFEKLLILEKLFQ